MERYSFKGYCSENRHVGINRIKEMINAHGYLLDFKMFSDIAISLMIEIQRDKLVVLYRALNNYMDMEAMDIHPSQSTASCIVFLNVTFRVAGGNLEIEIPDIPD